MTKEEKIEKAVRPIYERLIGYMSQAPSPEKPSDTTRDSSLWTQLNGAIDELNKIGSQSGKNYSQFKITGIQDGYFGTSRNPTYYKCMALSEYRTKLSGLIMQLRAEYFSEEPRPFTGTPTTVFSQTQQQNQTTFIQILLDFQSRIDEKIPQYPVGSKEKGFLEKLKGALGSVSTFSGLLKLVLEIGRDSGISIQQILEMLF